MMLPQNKYRAASILYLLKTAQKFWLFCLIVTAAATFTAANTSHAQQQTPDPCKFGRFEIGLPGSDKFQQGKCIDEVAPKGASGQPATAAEIVDKIAPFIGTIATIVVALIVAAGLIMVVVGGYIYMTAGGSASRTQTAKTVIGFALLGITIALSSYVILRFVNPALVGEQLNQQ